MYKRRQFEDSHAPRMGVIPARLHEDRELQRKERACKGKRENPRHRHGRRVPIKTLQSHQLEREKQSLQQRGGKNATDDMKGNKKAGEEGYWRGEIRWRE